MCRSPFAHALLAEQLNRNHTIQLRSAGTRATAGQHICPVVATELGDNEFAQTHVARPLSAKLIEGADLILTAELKQRASVARLSPAARSRTFTLIEAATLTEAIDSSRRERIGAGIALPSLGESFEELVARLDGARGLAHPIERKHRWFERRTKESAADALTIPDGHNVNARAHKSALGVVSASSDQLANWLRANLA
ncbi:hypothetical protein G3T37_01205 [Galbitalea soli]|uniref:Phosphotyrosine protein phosphatase I domain-containing protein n=1 Tax=Galbitalea soli TaxID=1268042 RepID=A0A7C9PLA9_9MICO|nr:hypothetical protein [Galbitalea soli]NYJ30675.1 protein-tyrosine phosphatase [Galbitalea soli]